MADMLRISLLRDFPGLEVWEDMEWGYVKHILE